MFTVGSPAGMVHSSSYGFISYIAKNVQMTDGNARVLYADVKSRQMPVLSCLIQMESLLAGGLTAMTRMWKLGWRHLCLFLITREFWNF